MKISNLNAGVMPANTQGKDAPKVANKDVVSLATKSVGTKLNESLHEKKIDREGANEVMNEELFQKSVEQANKSLDMYNRKIERSVHEVTHTVMYIVRDTRTNEVIQEFPPKKIQDMIAKMWELAGLFVDEKA